MRIYTKDNKKYISVTTIVGLMYGFDETGFDLWALKNGYYSWEISQRSKDIGTLVHEWHDSLVRGIPEYCPLPASEKEQNYYNAVEKFAKENPCVKSEFEVYNEELNYAGRVDGSFPNSIYDLKTFGAWKPKFQGQWVWKRSKDKVEKTRVQLSLYRDAIGEGGINIVHLKPNGEYEVEELKYTSKGTKWVKRNQAKIIDLLGNETEIDRPEDLA